MLRRPSKGLDPRDPPALEMYAVEAREIDPPPGEEPIFWRLLTTHKINSLADAARMIYFYRLRWNIDIDQTWRLSRIEGGPGLG